MRVLPLGAYDAILGYDWLKLHSPMSCHWEERTISFMEQGNEIILKGVPPPSHRPQEVPVHQVVKWFKGNDVWALAVVEEIHAVQEAAANDQIQQWLTDFQDVFRQPTSLPPSRVYDHHIPLLPNVVPVNSKPYKHSPQHKDEIEKQVKELLAAGLITDSTIPFASPMLLVLRKGGTWHFCVDYRKLNSLTVSTRFPMPLIDEILDESVGTKYFTKLDMRAGYHQVRMKEADEYKTTFKTHQGHY